MEMEQFGLQLPIMHINGAQNLLANAMLLVF